MATLWKLSKTFSSQTFLRVERSGVPRVLCLDAVFAVTEAPSQSICVQRVCSELTFRRDVGCHQHTSSNTAQSLITCLTLTFALAFISLPPDLWTGILQKQAHVCCHGCNPEAFHLWPVRLFLRGNGDLTQEMRPSYATYSSSDIKEGDLSPDQPERAMNQFLKREQGSLLFSSRQAWSFHFLRPQKTSVQMRPELLLLTGETEADRLRCKHLTFGSPPKKIGPAVFPSHMHFLCIIWFS